MASVDLLLDLQTRHEELLRQLDELDKRVEKALAECQGYRDRPGRELPPANAA